MDAARTRPDLNGSSRRDSYSGSSLLRIKMNKNSKVLALKYRPQTFDQLIGQKVVSETITNSIKLNKVPNAYLFTGIRGVGKTTIARIVAKSLNCLNGIENICTDKLCESCESITNSRHIDVLEQDAASKTSVDDVRDLIEFSRYGPTSAKYKIFIIDEVHMLSKQAFNALLKTLEEPPEYLKFIFATTEIKKIPITVVSRCQRFDLSRIKSTELFEFLKKIKAKEKGKVSDEALKLIVKISEGSVRDALSLLDRALLSLDNDKELDLDTAQKIFGYFDKSQLIDLFELIIKGEETKVIEIYRKIYDQGIEPKIFINDFLELVYYFKNINSLNLESTNFSLNDDEFSKIKKISNSLDDQTLILFWQFTIKTLGELDIVSNQNLSVEMFLIRLMHLKSLKSNDDVSKEIDKIKTLEKYNENKNIETTINNDAINQIKNTTQEKKVKLEKENEVKAERNVLINTLDELIDACSKKKEIKLKYELEKNVNLVRFENNRIEISFNDDLDKNFVKDLSLKLFEWTGQRWIISFSKIKGELSIKDKEKNNKIELLNKAKQTSLFKAMIDKFPDANLIDVTMLKKKLDD
ncbi:DNA polymerase III subunit gamma/tau [Candidatus Pelagibacter sp.]|nr:DNA polymerase III subunit gamma/tau [Candidatus Pelagibacter sp.]